MATEKSIVLVEDTFSKYLLGSISLTELQTNLATALQNMPFEHECEFVVKVKLASRPTNRFFGIEVFPCEPVMMNMTAHLLSGSCDGQDFIQKWRSITCWKVCIDALCLDHDFIAFNPKELTAMLMHELGRVMVSDQPPQQFYEAYLAGRARMRNVYNISAKTLANIYAIPMAIACTPKFWVDDENNVKLDSTADATLIETGYSDHLMSAMTKIVKKIGNRPFSPDNCYEVNASIDWANKNIVDVYHRKNELLDELYYIAIQRNDGYIPNLCDSILNSLGVALRERYSGHVVPSYGTGVLALADGTITLEAYQPIFDAKRYATFESCWASAQEAFMNRFTKKRTNLPTQYDIDRILVEIDRIQNASDRIYVLDMIYSCVQKIDMFEESLMDDPNDLRRWESKLAEMRDTLDHARRMVLDKKNFDKSYKLWVKVPEGYEG